MLNQRQFITSMNTSFSLEITGNIDEKISVLKKIEEHLKSIEHLSEQLSSNPISVLTKEVLFESL